MHLWPHRTVQNIQLPQVLSIPTIHVNYYNTMQYI